MAQEKDYLLRHPKDPAALLDVLRDAQSRYGHIPDEAVSRIAAHLKLSEAEIRGAVTFYHFFSLTPRGASTVYLNDSITSRMKGRTAVAGAFEEEAGCRFGEVSPDGKVGLFPTSCIGMNDQEPSAIIDGVIFPGLSPEKARAIVRGLRAGRPPGTRSPPSATAPISRTSSGPWCRTTSANRARSFSGPMNPERPCARPPA